MPPQKHAKAFSIMLSSLEVQFNSILTDFRTFLLCGSDHLQTSVLHIPEPKHKEIFSCSHVPAPMSQLRFPGPRWPLPLDHSLPRRPAARLRSGDPLRIVAPTAASAPSASLKLCRRERRTGSCKRTGRALLFM